MMWFGVITLFPEMFTAISNSGITSKAIHNGFMDLKLWNPRDFTEDKHRTVDDRPYGGGPGMLMKVEPLKRAIIAAKDYVKAQFNTEAKVVYLSPQGRRFEQANIPQWSENKYVIFVAGRYEGVDQRLIDALVDEEWSIGDFVLTGGELAAMVIIDAVVRTLPGVLGNDLSPIEDSFMQGLLDCPHYTRPENYDGQVVPPVLLSGNHEAIARWRLKQALGATWLRRKDLIEAKTMSPEQSQLLKEFIDEYDPESDS